MKGFRTFVLHDIAHVFPSKGFQSQLVQDSRQSASHVHTSATSNRFWNLFEFTPKEEICHKTKKCAPSGDFASTSAFNNTDFDSFSRNYPSLSLFSQTPVALDPKSYQFDLKSTPMSCLKYDIPAQQDRLTALLDGNPVPRTLKWKLKGYRTLRNEQAGDFAFIPGAKTYELDIISKNENFEQIIMDPVVHEKESSKRDDLKVEENSSVDQKDTLCLTNKAIENKAARSKEVRSVINVLSKESDKKIVIANNVKDDKKETIIRLAQKISALPKLLVSSLPKKEDLKFLPVSKSELSAFQLKYQTQPAAQYSSRPPKRFWKPSAPVMKPTTEKRPVNDTKRVVARSAPPMESYNPKEVSENVEPQLSTAPEQLSTKRSEASENVQRELSSREEEISNANYKEERLEDDQDTSQFSSKPGSSEQEIVPLAQPYQRPYRHEESLSMEAQPEPQPEPPVQREPVEPRKIEEDGYFAPRSSKRSLRPTQNQQLSASQDRPSVFESVIGLPSRSKPVLNITAPSQSSEMESTPCAATRVRLQQGSDNRGRINSNDVPLSGNRTPPSSGNSNSGSRKPPRGSFPPFPSRHACSNSCLLRSLTRRTPKDIDGGSRRNVNSNNPSSNISTSSRNPAPRKCGDRDDSNNCNQRRSCKPQRECKAERPQCKKPKKVCKRYCCPALQSTRDCDFSQYQCPKTCNNVIPKHKKTVDPTCLPDEKAESREICTSGRSKSCKRERQCKRREPSCKQERQPCKRRSQQQSCGQQDQGREICTKPQRRNSCKKQRKCDDGGGRRSQNCSGRRHYTQTTDIHRWEPDRNVRRYSSLPVFAFSLAGRQTIHPPKPQLLEPLFSNRFYGKDSKPPSCKSSKTESKCKKPTKCKTEQKESKCGPKKQDACKIAQGSCGQKKDPCKKQPKCPPRKTDSCGKSKTEDTCGKKREMMCKERKQSKSSSECGKDRISRERKELKECKKGGKDKAEKKPTGLERVVSPCKQNRNKGSKCKFVPVDIPCNCITNTISTTAFRPESCKPLIVCTDRSYSTTMSSQFDSEPQTPIKPEKSSWRVNDDNFSPDEIPVHISTDNADESSESYTFSGFNWPPCWFDGSHY